MVKKKSYAFVIILLLGFFWIYPIYAQGYRKLNAEDFRGKPETNDRYLSYTKLRIGYSSTATKKGSNYSLTFHVYLDINKAESWMKFDKINSRETFVALLNHEQGHFKIGALMQQELMQRLKAKRYSSHYKQEAATIFNKVATKYHLLQLQYDKETRHMMNIEKQKQWDEKLNSSLIEYGILP